MKSLITLFLLTLSLLMVNCKSKSNASFEGDMSPVAAGNANVAAPPAGEARSMKSSAEESITVAASVPEPVRTEISSKIIKDGRMELAVKDLRKAKDGIDTLLRKYNGYYSNESYNNTDYSDNYTLSIRIPASRFELFIVSLEDYEGTVIYKSISSRDVTEEFIDLETRLKNNKNFLNRYNELLKQAHTVKDILEIQENTRIIEEEIESTEGRLKYLNNQVSYSTLELVISKNNYSKYTRAHGSFFDRVKTSLVKGWFGLVAFFLFVIKIWPFWIIIWLIYILFRRVKFKRKKK
jgi:hypothetical protein